MGFFQEFKDFLKQYNVITLTIAFVMGAASQGLVKSLVDNIFMPLITPFISKGAWEQATLSLGPVIIRWGLFVSSLLNFVILAVIIFFIAKWLIKDEKKQNKKKKK